MAKPIEFGRECVTDRATGGVQKPENKHKPLKIKDLERSQEAQASGSPQTNDITPASHGRRTGSVSLDGLPVCLVNSGIPSG